jgi:hypothetical protein
VDIPLVSLAPLFDPGDIVIDGAISPTMTTSAARRDLTSLESVMSISAPTEESGMWSGAIAK